MAEAAKRDLGVLGLDVGVEGYVYHSLNSLKGISMGYYLGDYYKVYEGGY